MVAFYNVKDRAIYDAGDKFMSQSKYLQNDYTPTEGISYEGDGSPVSYANSGIMTQAPIPGPLNYIPPNDGGGGGGGGDDDDDDENTTNAGITSKMDIAKNVLGFMMNPIAFGLTKAYQGYKNNQKQKADALADKNYKEQLEKDAIEMAANTTNRDGTTAAYNYAGRVSSGGRHDSTKSNEEAQANQDAGRAGQYKADGGRVGYFFGGRVNYKVGGRTDAGANRSTASKAGVGQINEAGNKVDGGNYNDGGNDGGGIKPAFYDNGIQVITNQSKLGFNYPTGLTKNLGIGQLTAILNAKKSLEEEEPAGFVQYDSSMGPFDTRATYDTTTGPEFSANYTRNNFDVDVNSKTGLSGRYSKEIGPGTFTLNGNLRPDGTYDTEGKYVISYANGGLAGLL